jgi:arylsulfatase A-like enzyme
MAVAAWFGLVAGLVEGAGLLSFQKLGWLNWMVAQVGVWHEILWISPAFDLLLFVVIGLLLAPILRLTPENWRLPASVFTFSFLMFLDWVLLTGRIRQVAALPLAAGLAAVAMRRVKRNEVGALRFFRRTLPVLAGITLLLLVGLEGGRRLNERAQTAKLPAAPAGTPNILVILVDTLRADHLSTYGYGRSTSPHIDDLAKQGTLFERAFAASSWTLPSHASLLTGRYPHEHGAVNQKYDGQFFTIGEALRERGYRTAAFSANVYFFTRRDGFGQGFLHFEDFFHNAEDRALRTVYGRKFYQYVVERITREDFPTRKSADDVNRALLGWLEGSAGRPFFAFLNYFDTHDPYLPPAEYWKRFSKLERPPGHINEWAGRIRPKLTPVELQAEIDAYDASIAYVDEQIGRLMAELKRRGLSDNTLVVVTSDHGESLGEHGLFTHRNALYRELIQVPLIFLWPGQVPAGVRVRTPVTNVALPSTLEDLIGGRRSGFPGASLAAFWRVPDALPDVPDPLSELSQMPFEPMKPAPAYYGAMQSLVSPEWHYIHNDKLGAELFRWEQDPAESENLASTPDGQRITEEFAVKLKALRAAARKNSDADARRINPAGGRNP